MRASSLKIILLLLALTTGFATSTCAAEAEVGLSEDTQGAIGCLSLSSVVMTAAMWAGPSELIMIAAGGLLVPSGTTPLVVSLTATLIAASCSIGSEATPVALWFAEQTGMISGASTSAPDTTRASTNASDAYVAISSKESVVAGM
jgi:hypothetical protein